MRIIILSLLLLIATAATGQYNDTYRQAPSEVDLSQLRYGNHLDILDVALSADPKAHATFTKSLKNRKAAKIFGISTAVAAGAGFLVIASDNEFTIRDGFYSSKRSVYGGLLFGLGVPLGVTALSFKLAEVRKRRKAINYFNASRIPLIGYQGEPASIRMGNTRDGVGFKMRF